MAKNKMDALTAENRNGWETTFEEKFLKNVDY
jgi:hypothetical protein